MGQFVLLIVSLLWVCSVAGTYVYGTLVGRDREIAKNDAVNAAIKETRLAAQQGAADAIAKIKITNTTIRAATQTIIRDNVRYVDCRHAPGMFDSINESLTGQPKPPGNSELPEVNAVN